MFARHVAFVALFPSASKLDSIHRINSNTTELLLGAITITYDCKRSDAYEAIKLQTSTLTLIGKASPLKPLEREDFAHVRCVDLKPAGFSNRDGA